MTVKEDIERFLRDKPAQVEREYFINYGVLPTIGASYEEKEKARKRAVWAVYEMGVGDGKRDNATK